MSALSDGIAAAKAAVAALKTQLETVATDLQTEIAEIAAKIAAGGVTQEDLDGLNELQTTLAGMGGSVQTLDDNIKNIVTP